MSDSFPVSRRFRRDVVSELLQAVDSPMQWQQKRQNILQVWSDYFGGLPDRTTAVTYTLVAESKHDGYRRQHLHYTSADGEQVPAYLLIPEQLSEQADEHGSPSRFPAIMALHSAAKGGKENVATESGPVHHRYGVELAKRGYVVLAPDTIELGEREHLDTASFYRQYPGWSVVGKMLTDHLYGVDLLSQLEFVDSGKIGAIGHSMGAYNTYFLAGIDQRIRAFAGSCGFSPLAGDPRPERWGMESRMSHLPRISQDLQAGSVPFDFHEIAALAAPTPAFYFSGMNDKTFPHWQHISNAMLEIQKVYALLAPDSQDQFHYVMSATGHVFTQDVREMAYRFFDRHLKD